MTYQVSTNSIAQPFVQVNPDGSAATSPAIGTAGTPSADVISVQGVTAGKPVPVTGFAAAIYSDQIRTAVSFTWAATDDYDNAAMGWQLTPAGGNMIPVYGGYVYDPVALTWNKQRGDKIGSYTVAKPATSGGLLIARMVASAGANIKNSAGQVYGGTVMNTNAAVRYLHLYNKASAATLSTDTPVATFALTPNVSVPINLADLGAAFATGISWAFTTDDIAIPTTAGAATDIHGTLFYK